MTILRPGNMVDKESREGTNAPGISRYYHLLLSVLFGGLIGSERQRHDKPAGFRTNTLICFGATLFTMFSIRIAGSSYDPGRIAAQIVTGVGFLGAGAIIHQRGMIKGLTTAATIWLVASIGVGVGIGEYMVAGVGTIIALGILRVFDKVEKRLEISSHTRTYRVVVQNRDALESVKNYFCDSGLRSSYAKILKSHDQVIYESKLRGRKELHDKLSSVLLESSLVDELTF
ncbi:MAG: MgtC/SapB family protein [Candidatus Eisenbacteria bacterium]|nr:MgtC/SapB family protein [Candidatus Eisenbacteria bacterium]